MQPRIYLCQTEGSNASVIACFYLEMANEIYGWRVSGSAHHFAAAFFMMEDFYESGHAVLYRSVEDDVYGPWMVDIPRRRGEVRSPLPEPILHELERLQSLFVQEWLFFENDPESENEIAAYERHHLPVQAVNIRLRKLGRLAHDGRGWEYRTPGFDKNVSEYLHKYMRDTDIFIEKLDHSPRQAAYMQNQWQ